MMSSKSFHSAGFSLVELAIVLVIIGLITGGILTGQDLIRASELNSVMADVNKFKTATNTFRIKYNSLPGDLRNAQSYWGINASCASGGSGTGTQTCNGNGDGKIAGTGPTGTESNWAWQHLSLAGLIPGNYTGNSLATLGTSIPTSRITGAGYWIGNTYVGFPVHTYNGLHIQISTPYMGGMGGGVLSPAETNSIDAKYDDGLPHRGSVLSDESAPSYTGCLNGTFNAYVLTTTTPACQVNFTY